jgi:polyhydroxyalkanoate synthesis regulator phasin
MKNQMFDEEQFFNQIKNRARAEGVASREEWEEVVGEMVDDRLDVGEMNKDQNLEEIKEVLRARYEEYEAEI